MEILYENKNCLVAVKAVGVLSQKGRKGDSDMVTLLSQTQKGSLGSIYLIHRLDKEVGGVMLFAKNHAAASFYASAVENRKVQKEYLAVVRGIPEAPKGEWRDFLFRDEEKRRTITVAAGHKGAKEARLRYELLETKVVGGETVSLLRIELLTGRNHQIRVQCASRHLPLLGDGLYGEAKDGEAPALFAFRLCFPEMTGGEKTVSALPSGGIWDEFSIELPI